MSLAGDASEKFCLIRQDSNGAHVIEKSNLSRADADEIMRQREAQIGAHHQTVWVERYPPPADLDAKPL